LSKCKDIRLHKIPHYKFQFVRTSSSSAGSAGRRGCGGGFSGTARLRLLRLAAGRLTTGMAKTNLGKVRSAN